ncbi:MAG: ABC transporter substrate-binding protein, partial [Lachnospiraceae bacterium]|nr:ABC transporter substrate-binding protein [Lachnospiraceae bacterium]
MKKRFKKLLSLTLSLVLALSLSACGGGTTSPEPTTPDATTETPAATTETPSQAPEATPAPEPTTLVVGYSAFSEKFSPFFSKTAYDQDAAGFTQVGLIGNDRAGELILNGIKGETINYNGTDYFYDGIADVEVVQNADGTVDYNITIRDDIVFSDGVKMTIDDVIFNMYVLSDPTYDGSSTFYSTPVTGMNNYRTGVSDEIYTKYEALGQAILAAGPENTDFSEWTEEQSEAFWGICLERGGTAFAQEIIDYCMANYAA